MYSVYLCFSFGLLEWVSKNTGNHAGLRKYSSRFKSKVINDTVVRQLIILILIRVGQKTKSNDT